MKKKYSSLSILKQGIYGRMGKIYLLIHLPYNAMSAENTFQERKDAVVKAAMFLASFEGWSEATLVKASVKVGFPALEARLLFPGGVGDALNHYTLMIDHSLKEKAFEKELSTMRVHERIYWLVKTRLEFMRSDKDALRQAAAWRLVRNYGIQSMKGLWGISDTLWQLAGDTSTDSNYYTKRALLLKVYISTFLYWINDVSENDQDTGQFLERRIESVLKTGKKIGMLRTSLIGSAENIVDQLLNRQRYRAKR